MFGACVWSSCLFDGERLIRVRLLLSAFICKQLELCDLPASMRRCHRCRCRCYGGIRGAQSGVLDTILHCAVCVELCKAQDPACAPCVIRSAPCSNMAACWCVGGQSKQTWFGGSLLCLRVAPQRFVGDVSICARKPHVKKQHYFRAWQSRQRPRTGLTLALVIVLG